MKTLNLSEIIIDPEIQTRLGMDPEAVADFRKALDDGAKFPPLDVFYDGKDYWLANGFHRYHAANENGQVTFPCEIHEGGKDAAQWFAAGANKSSNSVRLKSGDISKAVELLLTKFRDKKTQQQIADHVGCSQGYVARIQSSLLQSNKLALPRAIKGGDGKIYPTTYQKKPSSAPPPKSPSVSPAQPLDWLVDKLGVKIPPAILPLWERGDKAAELLEHISKVRSTLRNAQESNDPVYKEVNFSSVSSNLNQAYADIKVIKPYSVCPTCQGKVTEGCSPCKGRGYVSEFYWNSCVPSEVKVLRAKAVAAAQKGKEL